MSCYLEQSALLVLNFNNISDDKDACAVSVSSPVQEDIKPTSNGM